jgi:hypothetical protein
MNGSESVNGVNAICIQFAKRLCNTPPISCTGRKDASAGIFRKFVFPKHLKGFNACCHHEPSTDCPAMRMPTLWLERDNVWDSSAHLVQVAGFADVGISS